MAAVQSRSLGLPVVAVDTGNVENNFNDVILVWKRIAITKRYDTT